MTPSAIEARCPKCGNDGSRGAIRYLVDVVCRADVIRVGDGAVLELAGPLREGARSAHASALRVHLRPPLARA